MTGNAHDEEGPYVGDAASIGFDSPGFRCRCWQHRPRGVWIEPDGAKAAILVRRPATLVRLLNLATFGLVPDGNTTDPLRDFQVKLLPTFHRFADGESVECGGGRVGFR